ncbi:MAG: prepilin peptidase [Acetobacterium woodii]|nr:prepilin peptidase [Acetobacterium woodii]
MSTVLYIIIFILGTIVGSFLNVVIFRYNTGVSFFSGRSFCPSCGKKLSWYELVPIVSFIALRRKCAGCGSKISFQYPLVEIATGILFLLTIFNFQFSIFKIEPFFNILYYWIIWSILVIISVYDLRHKIIPDLLVFLFAGLSLAHLVVSTGWGNVFHTPYLWDFLAGPLFALPFAALWFFSQGKWMGLGDAKLALGIGWFLGLIKGGSAIILGFWMGAIVGLALVGISKPPHQSPPRYTTASNTKTGMPSSDNPNNHSGDWWGGKLSIAKHLHSNYGLKSEIPFGPFLILGTIIAFFFNINVFDLGFVLF